MALADLLYMDGRVSGGNELLARGGAAEVDIIMWRLPYAELDGIIEVYIFSL